MDGSSDKCCCENEVIMVVWCDVITPPAKEAGYIREEKTRPIFRDFSCLATAETLELSYLSL